MDIVSYIKSFPIVSFSRNETILQTSDSTETIFAIREGFIKVMTLDDAGRQKLLWVAGRYDVVPSERLFSSRPVEYFYTGLSSGSAYAVNREELIKHGQTNPQVMSDIARGLSEHHDDMLARMNAIEQSDVHTKLLFIIHTLCQRFSSTTTFEFHEIGLHLTHQDFADMIGSSREVVSGELHKLRQEGLIDYTRTTFTAHTEAIEQKITAPA